MLETIIMIIVFVIFALAPIVFTVSIFTAPLVVLSSYVKKDGE